MKVSPDTEDARLITCPPDGATLLSVTVNAPDDTPISLDAGDGAVIVAVVGAVGACLNVAMLADDPKLPPVNVHVGLTAAAVGCTRSEISTANAAPDTASGAKNGGETVVVVVVLPIARPATISSLFWFGVTLPGCSEVPEPAMLAPLDWSSGDVVETPEYAATEIHGYRLEPETENVCPVPTIGLLQ